MNVGLPNFFAITNINDRPSKTQTGWREQTQSLYASADLGYKNTYYLTLTGRNDWPSQLAGPDSKSSSFFYPSVGVSVLMNQMFCRPRHRVQPEIISFWKIRASWASVGTAFPASSPTPHTNGSAAHGRCSHSIPWATSSPSVPSRGEVGMNFRFLTDLTFDATWYLADTYNQTFNPNLAVGKYSNLYVQAGNVRNWGMEFALNYEHTWGNFTWSSGLTYSFSKNKIRELSLAM